MNFKPRCAIAAVLFAAAECLLGFAAGRAEEPAKEAVFYYNGGIGYHYADVDDSREKVGEYEVLDAGMEGFFDINAAARGRYFDLGGVIRDKDDQQYVMAYDRDRLFLMEASYQRFRHYLDHDRLKNQDFYTDFDAGKSNSIIREEIKSENTFRLPLFPDLKLTADFRQLNKRGHRQATAVSKCGTCHVTSRNRRINQTTRDLLAGAEMKIGNVTLGYRHLQRSYSEGGDAPMAYYGSEAGSFPVKGYARYSDVADTRTYVNRFTAAADLPLQSDLFIDYESGKNKNRDTGNEREFESFAVRLSSACLKYITLHFNYFDYNMDTDVDGGLEKDLRRSGFSFRTRSWKKSFIRGSYRHEHTDRNHSAATSTLKKIFTLALFSRPHRKLNFNLRYRSETTSDPFVAEKWETFRFAQTSLPTRRDDIQLTVNWNPGGNLSLSSTLRYEESESSRYYVDEDRCELIFSFWFAPSEKIILTGSYSLIDTDINARTSYKTYHRSGSGDYLLYRSSPYDDRTRCYNLNATYRLSRRTSLIGSVTYVDSGADFDTIVNGRDIGRYSDLHLERLDASLGMNYLYSHRVSFYTGYNYRDYNDREDNDLDGKAHILSCGMSYSF